jgi:CubicO group peptidase (beta-lactamase class C family)
MKQVTPLCFALLCVAATGPLQAQEVVRLERGRPHEAELTSDGLHAYAADLDAGQFVYGEAIQHTMDVVVTVYGPDGGEITVVDVTARGPEPFTFTTEAAGAYRIEVTPFERQSGRYTLVLRRAEPVATTPEGKVDQLMAAHDADDRPGGVVAVIRGGEVDFVRVYGLADLTHGVPNTPETLFNIGSVSKQFAGIFFAMMAEEGRLSLDDDVRTYLPELPDLGPTVTLRHLLNHTSGYREVYGILGMQGRSVAGDILRREDAVEVVRNQPALQFAPGSRHLYNSTAYVILTTAAERIAGQPYPDWMAEHVFGPLGMTATRIEREPGEVIPGSAYSYTTTATGAYREDFEAYAYYGATDVYTNVHDLARWLGNFRTSVLGGPGVMRRMQEKSVLANGDTLGYTLGLSLDRHLGLDRIQHGGATGGYRAFLAYYPALDAAVVVLANTGAVNTGAVAEETAAAFFAEHVRPEPPAADPPPGRTVDAALLDAYAGPYWIEGAGRYAVTRDADGLAMRTAGGRTGPLIALDDSTFWFDTWGSVRFHRDRSGAVPRATLRVRGEGDRPMRRLASASTEPNLSTYAGRYFSEEVEAFYTITAADGALTLTHRRLGTIPLQPQAPDVFTGQWPVREVAFEWDEAGRVTGFRATEGRTIGVHFRRQE